MPVDTAPTRAIPDPMRPLLYVVVANEPAARATVTLTLEPVGGSIEPVDAGQFNMLWAWGFGEVPISVSGLPTDGRLVHTIRDVGPVTKSLCASQAGDVIGVRGPFGVGWPVESARGHDVVIVAGGIGLAPIRPVVHKILAQREAFGHVTLVVGARNAHDLLYRDELDSWWRERRIRVRTIVDEPCSHWTAGSVGIVTHELHRVEVNGPNTAAMLCGPEVMMRIVGGHLLDEGVHGERISVSLERNMQCGIGLCGHCQLAGRFVCVDGPVFSWGTAQPLLAVREL